MCESDLEKIQEQINIYNNNLDKKELIEELTNHKYEFDKITLIKLKNISESKNIDKRHELLRQIDKIAEKIVEHRSPEFTEKSIMDNIFIPCNSNFLKNYEQSYCSQKLLISEKKYGDIREIFADDLLNPIKRDYILNSVLLINIRNYFEFKKSSNEEIYIKFE